MKVKDEILPERIMRHPQAAAFVRANVGSWSTDTPKEFVEAFGDELGNLGGEIGASVMRRFRLGAKTKHSAQWTGVPFSYLFIASVCALPGLGFTILQVTDLAPGTSRFNCSTPYTGTTYPGSASIMVAGSTDACRLSIEIAVPQVVDWGYGKRCVAQLLSEIETNLTLLEMRGV